MLTTLLRNDAISRVNDLYAQGMEGRAVILPYEPILIFTNEEIQELHKTNPEKAIFLSYFASGDSLEGIEFSNPVITEFQLLLFSVYCLKRGFVGRCEGNERILTQSPDLLPFTFPTLFRAFYCCDLPPKEHSELVFGDRDDCLAMANELHGSPHLAELVKHVRETL